MADTTEQLQELNQNATLLLQKYDGVFSKLNEESQKILVAMASKSEEGLSAITELLESGNVATAENALKLGGKSLDEVLQYMIDNQPEPVSTVSKFDIFEDGSAISLHPLIENAKDIGGVYDGTCTDITYSNGAVLNGDSSYIDLEDMSDIKTISFHAKLKSNDGDGVAICNNTSIGWNFIGLAYGPITCIDTFGRDDNYDDNIRFENDGNQIINDLDTWHLVVFVLDGSAKGRFYLDTDELVNTTDNDFSGQSSFSTNFNTIGAGNSNCLDGTIKHVRFFNKAISADEVVILTKELE